MGFSFLEGPLPPHASPAGGGGAERGLGPWGGGGLCPMGPPRGCSFAAHPLGTPSPGCSLRGAQPGGAPGPPLQLVQWAGGGMCADGAPTPQETQDWGGGGARSVPPPQIPNQGCRGDTAPAAPPPTWELRSCTVGGSRCAPPTPSPSDTGWGYSRAQAPLGVMPRCGAAPLGDAGGSGAVAAGGSERAPPLCWVPARHHVLLGGPRACPAPALAPARARAAAPARAGAEREGC